MRVVLTGARGFLGWHTRLRLHATTAHEVIPVGRWNWDDLPRLCAGADAVIHLAGVNRGPDEIVEGGNRRLARDVTAAVRSAGTVNRVVYANSIHATSPSAYGKGKHGAGEALAALSADGISVVDVRLPNLFGEHGRPQYNSFVATFAHAVLSGGTPQVDDRPVGLLHVQGATDVLVDALTSPAAVVSPSSQEVSVASVLKRLQWFHGVYASGELPHLESPIDHHLFSTLRAAWFAKRPAIPLSPRHDARGHLVETVRAHGGEGQAFFSTTVPGVTRGEHYHLRKMERFVVVSGEAEIAVRRMFHSEVVGIAVSGDTPVAVDMPMGWTHNITNTGTEPLMTVFWTDELFNPLDADTHPEPVDVADVMP